MSADNTIAQDSYASFPENGHYRQASEIAAKQGWITVSLIQRRLRLGYGYTLSLVEALQRHGVIGPKDKTGKYPLRAFAVTRETGLQPPSLPAHAKSAIRDLALAALDGGGLLNQTGKILYSSHETLRPGSLYLMGLNPGGDGGPSLGENIRTLLDNTENAYLDEPWRGHGKGEAPLQKRVRWLLEKLGAEIRDVCATNLIFVQSRDDKGVNWNMAEQCWPVHDALLNIVQPSLIIAFGNSAFSPYGFMRKRFPGQETAPGPAGHGCWKLKRFQTLIQGRHTTVIGLPHLSRYQPMGKPEVESWLRGVLEDAR